jgi:anaerobic ribonucleoside-triphosphate reductase activating protein
LTNFLSIGSTLYPVSTLGPGNRFVIWVQGCPFNCKGCCSPDYIPFQNNKNTSVDSLADYIAALDGIDGVTFSGGEPFAQAPGLSLLIQKLKSKRPELNFISFTGFSFEALKSKAQKELLGLLDLVITELFVEEQNSEYGLRGSDNQKFIFLSDRLEPFREEIINGRKKTETFILNEQVVQVGVMSESERHYHQSLLEIIQTI